MEKKIKEPPTYGAWGEVGAHLTKTKGGRDITFIGVGDISDHVGKRNCRRILSRDETVKRDRNILIFGAMGKEGALSGRHVGDVDICSIPVDPIIGRETLGGARTPPPWRQCSMWRYRH